MDYSDSLKISALQKRAAGCTDKLLDITNSIQKDVLDQYSEENLWAVKLQCGLLLTRCSNLAEEFSEVSGEIQKLVEQNPDAVFAKTTAVTLKVINQDCLILFEKTKLLKQIMESGILNETKIKEAKAMDCSAQLIGLANALRGEKNAEENVV